MKSPASCYQLPTVVHNQHSPPRPKPFVWKGLASTPILGLEGGLHQDSPALVVAHALSIYKTTLICVIGDTLGSKSGVRIRSQSNTERPPKSTR
jgi:hypothetical protein